MSASIRRPKSGILPTYRQRGPWQVSWQLQASLCGVLGQGSSIRLFWHVCTYVYMYMYICYVRKKGVYIYIYIYMYVCMYVCMYAYSCTCVCVYGFSCRHLLKSYFVCSRYLCLSICVMLHRTTQPRRFYTKLLTSTQTHMPVLKLGAHSWMRCALL